MNRIGKTCSPALRVDGAWIVDPTAKANVFATAFQEKWELPAKISNEYSVISGPIADDDYDFLVLRTRASSKVLLALREDSGAGPDLLPARVLRRCSDELAVPVCKLCRRILHHSAWP
eukprot:10609594-Alexandrium_andersonii.AAC.1